MSRGNAEFGMIPTIVLAKRQESKASHGGQVAIECGMERIVSLRMGVQQTLSSKNDDVVPSSILVWQPLFVAKSSYQSADIDWLTLLRRGERNAFVDALTWNSELHYSPLQILVKFYVDPAV